MAHVQAKTTDRWESVLTILGTDQCRRFIYTRSGRVYGGQIADCCWRIFECDRIYRDTTLFVRVYFSTPPLVSISLILERSRCSFMSIQLFGCSVKLVLFPDDPLMGCSYCLILSHHLLNCFMRSLRTVRLLCVVVLLAFMIFSSLFAVGLCWNFSRCYCSFC